MPAAGREFHVGIRQHRHDLRPFRGFEGLPGLGSPGPSRVAETRAVGEEMTNGDGLDRAVWIMNLPQFGYVGAN